MTKKAVGLLFMILLLSLTHVVKAEPSGNVLTLPYVSDSSQCLVGTKAKDKVCIMIKDTIYNCKNIPVLVFDNPKDTSVRGIRDLESGVLIPLLNLSEKEDEMLKKQMRDLRILFFDFKQKKLLCKGVALATEANELHYEYLFRGVKLIEDEIAIFDFTNHIYVYFNIEDIKNGLFRIQYQDYDADRNSSIKGYYDSYIEAVKRALVKNDALDNRL